MHDDAETKDLPVQLGTTEPSTLELAARLMVAVAPRTWGQVPLPILAAACVDAAEALRSEVERRRGGA